MPISKLALVKSVGSPLVSHGASTREITAGWGDGIVKHRGIGNKEVRNRFLIYNHHLTNVAGGADKEPRDPYSATGTSHANTAEEIL